MGVLGDSSVPAFQDMLIKQLLARPNISSQNVSVVLGPPAPGVAMEHMWIALLTVDGTEAWSSLGRLQKQEIYLQEIYISVMTRDGEGDATAGRNQAYALRKEIADQLIADPTVGMTVWQCQLTKQQKFEPRLGITVPDAGGGNTVDLSWREACLNCQIEVKNRF